MDMNYRPLPRRFEPRDGQLLSYRHRIEFIESALRENSPNFLRGYGHVEAGGIVVP